MEDRIAELEDRVAQLEGEIDTLQDELADIEAEKIAAEELVKELTGKLSDIYDIAKEAMS